MEYRSFLACASSSFFDPIMIIDLPYFFFVNFLFNDLNNISENILFGSPETMSKGFLIT